MNLNVLPAEMLLHIFSYLDPTELCQLTGQVCRKWQALSYDPTLWKMVKLNGHIESQYEIQRIIAGSSSLVRGLSFTNIWDWSVTSALPKCSYLRTIHFNSCAPKRYHMSKLVAALPFIENIQLTVSQVSDCDIFHEIVKWIFLKAITIDTKIYECVIGSHILFLITNKCKRLECLSMDNHLLINDWSIINFTESHGSQLKALHVNVENLTQDGYRFLLNCPNMRDLHIYWPRNMTDSELLHLTGCTSLEKLNISSATFFPADYYITLFDCRSFFCVLDLSLNSCSYLNDRGIELISINFPVLKKLYLGDCRNVTDNGIIYIVNNSRFLETLKLYSLEITGSCFADIFKLTKLTFLGLIWCRMIKPEVLTKLMAQNPNLQIYAP